LIHDNSDFVAENKKFKIKDAIYIKEKFPFKGT